MMRSDVGAHKFDKDKWGTELAPILNLWKKLNQGSKILQQKLLPPKDDERTQPIESFILLEHYNAIQLAQQVHASLASLAKVIKGSQTTSVLVLFVWSHDQVIN